MWPECGHGLNVAMKWAWLECGQDLGSGHGLNVARKWV